MPPALRIQPCADPDFIDGLIWRFREQVGFEGSNGSIPSLNTIIKTPLVLALQAMVDDKPCGVWLIFAQEGRYMVHSLLLPSVRGTLAIALGKLGAKWIWEHTGWDNIWTTHKTSRKDVRLFSKLVGFTVVREYIEENGTPTTLLVIHRPKEDL